jgi:hypothetical protein
MEDKDWEVEMTEWKITSRTEGFSKGKINGIKQTSR